MMTSLWMQAARNLPRGAFHGPGESLALSALSGASRLASRLESLRGRSVVLAFRDQLSTAVALLELDGVARRMVLATPDLAPETLAAVGAAAGAEVQLSALDPMLQPTLHSRLGPAPRDGQPETATEWVLLTSGTTGTPKLVIHTLASLAGTLPRGTADGDTVWSTFYDIRRYGGLQIYLRAVLGGTPLVLSSAEESTPDFLARAGRHGVTHISGTPSHWRRVLMSDAAASIDPRYVRLSGEVADQLLLDELRRVYPRARIAHAFASTEAGVAFDVDDGQAGFPAEWAEGCRNGIEMKVQNDTLRIRSARNASSYLGAAARLADDDGYVDTGDLVELRDGRYYFLGRVGGVINVGGFKVYPEEVEAVLNADPRVRMSLVSSKRSPITGAIVVADVVLEGETADPAGDSEGLRAELLEACRRALPPHKVPARLRFVPALALTSAGKLVRPHA
jgi:acyl-CoA synthetase (AMP-forming)/AMP-acid ligase II